MGVKLQSALGGSVELNAPSTASNFTMTVPAGNGTVATTDQLVNFRNRIINGDMRIDQRNNGAAVTPSVNGPAYLLDRFFFYNSQVSRLTYQQNAGSVTPPVGFSKYFGITVASAATVGAGDVFLISQAIEGQNVADLDWGTANAATVSVSFLVRSSLTGNFSGALQNSGNTRTYAFSYAIAQANTWEKKTITVAGDTSGTWLTNNGTGISLVLSIGAGATFSTTAGSWVAGNTPNATGSVNLVATSGATFYVTGVQLEAGSVATPFERRPYGTELAMCQRYYEVGQQSRMYYGFVNSGITGAYQDEQFQVTKRVAPSITATGFGYWNNGSDSPVPTVSISSDTTTRRFNVICSGMTNWNGFNGVGVWTANAEI
jgi:hypothetical protein